MTDEIDRLVRRIRSGVEREESARRLDSALRPRLSRYFQSLGFRKLETEDLVQEAMIRVFRHVGALREEDRFVPWLFVVARNVARTAVQRLSNERARHAAEVDLDAIPGGSLTERDGEARKRLAAVAEAMRHLPEQQRRCLVLVVRDELSYREVGDLLGLSPLTVRNHLAEARRRLRRMLEEEVSGP